MRKTTTLFVFCALQGCAAPVATDITYNVRITLVAVTDRGTFREEWDDWLKVHEGHGRTPHHTIVSDPRCDFVLGAPPALIPGECELPAQLGKWSYVGTADYTVDSMLLRLEASGHTTTGAAIALTITPCP